MAPPLRLHVLLFENLPGIWVARGLEHDIGVEAISISAACQSLLQCVRAHVEFDRRHHLEPLSSFPAAPPSCWYAFSKATTLTSDLTGDDSWPLAGFDFEIVVAIANQSPAPALGEHRFLQDLYNMGEKRRRAIDY